MKIFGKVINHSPSQYNKSDDPLVIYRQWEHWKWQHHLQTQKACDRHSENLPDYLRIMVLEQEVAKLKEALNEPEKV